MILLRFCPALKPPKPSTTRSLVDGEKSASDVLNMAEYSFEPLRCQRGTCSCRLDGPL